MKKLSSGQEIQKRLVENITLLYTLCEVPGEPEENDVHSGHDEGRQLSRDRERQLTDSFAFISATTDDMLRVMAVSIEEDPDKKGMTIRLASNTGDLSDITQGLNGIGRTLEQASLRSRIRIARRNRRKADSGPPEKPRIDIQQDLFRQIVTLDEPRILSRLRAMGTRKGKKKSELLSSLKRVVHDESIFGPDEISQAKITSMRSCTIQLSEIFSQFETARMNHSPIKVQRDILIDLLIQIGNFDVDCLETVLAMSPVNVIHPDTKAYLPRAMRKIGRYFRIACDLTSAARSPEYTLFRRISVQSIEQPHFDMAFKVDHSVDFDHAVERVTRSSHQHFLDAYSSEDISAARTKFESHMTGRIASWKIHAEIQLLLFYVQHPHMPRPRIIGSSKSACYLCNLFIQLHGEFGTPRTHGRLYDRWILPEKLINKSAANTHLLSVIDRFNEALEAKITHVLTSQTRSFPHPNESVLFSRQPWSSNSTLAETLKQASIQEIVESTHSNPTKDQTRPLSNTSSRKQASIQETVDPTHSSSSRGRTKSPPNTSFREQASIQEIVRPPPASSSRERSPIQKIEPPTRPSPSIDQTAPQHTTPPRPNSSIDPKPPLHNPPPHSPPTPPASTPRDQSVPQPHLENSEPDIHRTQPSKPTPSITAPHHLYPGATSTSHKLLTPHDTLIIDTGPVMLHASCSNHPPDTLTNEPEHPRACWIHVQCTTSASCGPRGDDDEGNLELVDIESLAEDRDTVVEGGAAWSSKRLALRVRGQVIVVQYTFGDR